MKPPDPMTCHPTFAHLANTIREALPKGNDIVVKATEVTPRMQLTVLEHRAHVVPYVGDPAWFTEPPYYVWRSAVDEFGRAVAGPARLVMRVRA